MELIGEHPAIGAAKKMIEQAKTLRILFTGETGVGKTPFARYSNAVLTTPNSRRPFEQLNCACLTGEHFNDELFGHRRGAYTGAVSDRRGYIELAEGGDLFLDEIGELSPELQARLLTFLDHQEYYRLGDDRKRRANVRIISATNRDLKARVAQGSFRADLYSRLAQVTIALPPLRERRTDIPLLFSHFAAPYGIRAEDCDPEFIHYLTQLDWRDGNVRELRDTVDYLCTVAKSAGNLTIELLRDRCALPLPSVVRETVNERGLEDYLSGVESEILKQGLARYRGSPQPVELLAHQMKLSRSTLYRKLKKYQLL